MRSTEKQREDIESGLADADCVNAAINNCPEIVPDFVGQGRGRMPDDAAGKPLCIMNKRTFNPTAFAAANPHISLSAFPNQQQLQQLQQQPKKKKAAKKTAAPTKKKVAASTKNKSTTHKKSSWPKVKNGEWGYVYICGGPFAGRFGYYDDHEEQALVYFGAPLLGDGPYDVPLQYLRDPPASEKKNADFSPL
mmetsp:Transcript_3084/g.3465  ORF Transcript_3084/g.3465 Transcript_3084/m.3465 type:complete len:193 (-) Transcript_3084:62-640(-)